MDKKYTFNEDAENYDKYRPRYCQELFQKIIDYSKLNERKQALEIGIGTGQATQPILHTNCALTAVELGDNLAKYAQKKFSDYKKLKVENISFENFTYTPGSYDLIYSGTAFHWIPEEIGFTKSLDMLKRGGAIALFWNRPSGGDSELYNEIQNIYKKYMPSTKARKVTANKQIYNKKIKTIKDYGFVDVEFSLMNQTRIFNAEDYISLLNTYSDHRSLKNEIQEPFYNEIKALINRFGGEIKIYDTISLYLARKPK